MKKTIQLEIPDGKRAEWVNGVLTLVEDKPIDITERIKTFEDAMWWCTINGHNNIVVEYDNIVTDSLIISEPTSDLIAYLKLRIITAALNEGWEYKSDKQGFGAIMDDDRIRLYFHRTTTDMLVGRRLLFRTKKLAEYAAKQFRDIYADFCGCKKGGEK